MRRISIIWPPCGARGKNAPPWLPRVVRGDKGRNTSFNFKKADWNRFGDLCKLSSDDSVADIELQSCLMRPGRPYPFIKGQKIKPVCPGLPRNIGGLFGKGKRLKGSILKRLLLKISYILKNKKPKLNL
ncbi:hypothetical protein PoB_001748300 [Plakobranchus ocellatus]|uniref:Uncharacterized protein n=1 Tax=Plakobranchus ocellatus TaxID=259542 RepID=A0AAV3Z8A6_9GAST|nr:hypothetical protein PoB_001748300 [Plakobranchus ocellatus]